MHTHDQETTHAEPPRSELAAEVEVETAAPAPSNRAMSSYLPAVSRSGLPTQGAGELMPEIGDAIHREVSSNSGRTSLALAAPKVSAAVDREFGMEGLGDSIGVRTNDPLNEAVTANAFTVGSEIVLSRKANERTMAHEAHHAASNLLGMPGGAAGTVSRGDEPHEVAADDFANRYG